ncbi:hypothetical protein EVAR_22626_1 [Eumeta japonica]|uniref:Uncharacterized protein n=1 Tax=Eumeta variegata TaxID=151549 RepID=A0A4C1VLD4_EUMVA|nr:hypothetical protein EVAR_22626_1 [Eumeta japonica]
MPSTQAISATLGHGFDAGVGSSFRVTDSPPAAWDIPPPPPRVCCRFTTAAFLIAPVFCLAVGGRTLDSDLAMASFAPYLVGMSCRWGIICPPFATFLLIYLLISNLYIFAKGSSLTPHLRKVHKLASDYSPLTYICKVCQEAFVKFYNLQRHRCYGVKPGIQKTHNNAPTESQNPTGNVTTQTVIDLTDGHNAPCDYLPNGNSVGNPTVRNLNSIDIEVPVIGSTTENEDLNAVTPTDAQVPVVSTSTYEFDNYKLVLTEVPIEF